MDRKWIKFYEAGVVNRLEYPDTTLPETLRAAAQRFPDQTAMVYLDHRWSYRELDAIASQMANTLVSLGVAAGDRVGIHLPNSAQFVAAYYGIVRAGAVAVAINPLFSGDDFAFIIDDSDMKAMITCLELLPVFEVLGKPGVKVLLTDVRTPFGPAQEYEAPPYAVRLEKAVYAQSEVFTGPGPGPDSIANLQYTGGTTGRSKGAILTHRNLATNALQFRHFFRNVYEDGAGGFVCVIPLFHIYGLTTSMLAAVISGSTMLLLPKFDLNELMRVIDHYRPNLFMGVPAMYGAIAMREGHTYDLSSIKACMSGSAPLPLAIQEKFEKITGGKLREGYGLTEAAPAVCINPIYGLVKPGSVGVPFPDTDVRIVDAQTGEDLTARGEVGELIVRGPQVMQGYWQKPEETALVLQDGWLHTGDLARMDEDGYIYITDRLKDMIIMGGEKIYPREIEDLLYTHPAIREAAVIGVPHPLRGEVPQAFVALKEGAAASEKEIRQFCHDHLSRFKVPHKIELVDALPRNSVGKVLRRLLRDKKNAING